MCDCFTLYSGLAIFFMCGQCEKLSLLRVSLSLLVSKVIVQFRDHKKKILSYVMSLKIKYCLVRVRQSVVPERLQNYKDG